jgi:23S rRNA (guanine2445-N2)-methyltransferase / 23S rRNA (guanine2069-N7)-methyltransferase
MAAEYEFFATAAKGLAEVLAEELTGLGLGPVQAGRGGVHFRGPLAAAYRACLWSRVASRVFLPLASFKVLIPSDLYDGARQIPWHDHLAANGTLAVDCATTNAAFPNSQFAAVRVKDAIVDQFRDRSGERPSVPPQQPDLRVHLHFDASRATISLDLSGDSLHRRGYRQKGLTAPLKETLAAGILMILDWPKHAANRIPLLDPMCGSGTLLSEAALIAMKTAPGRQRTHFGFSTWRGHQPQLWQDLLAEADALVLRDPKKLPVLRGYDALPAAVAAAIDNLDRIGARGFVHVEKRQLAQCEPLDFGVQLEPQGILVTNPPYGERLGEVDKLRAVYAELGDLLRRRFLGWEAYILAGNPELARSIGLKAARRTVLFNGAIECRLLKFPISRTAPTEGPRWRQK